MNKKEILVDVAIVVLCGVLAFVCLAEMNENVIRLSYSKNYLFKSFVSIICFCFSGVVAILVIIYNGDFTHSNVYVRMLLGIYLLCS